MKTNFHVLSTTYDSERSLRPEVHAVDRLVMPRDLAHRRAGVHDNHLLVAGFSTAHADPLVVRAPPDVFHLAAENLVLSLLDLVAPPPDLQLATSVSARYISSIGRELDAGHRLAAVFFVNHNIFLVLQVVQHHVVARRVRQVARPSINTTRNTSLRARRRGHCQFARRRHACTRTYHLQYSRTISSKLMEEKISKV